MRNKCHESKEEEQEKINKNRNSLQTSCGQMFGFVDILYAENDLELMRFSCLPNFLCVNRLFSQIKIISWVLPHSVANNRNTWRLWKRFEQQFMHSKKVPTCERQLLWLAFTWCEFCISFFAHPFFFFVSFVAFPVSYPFCFPFTVLDHSADKHFLWSLMSMKILTFWNL